MLDGQKGSPCSFLACHLHPSKFFRAFHWGLLITILVSSLFLLPLLFFLLKHRTPPGLGPPPVPVNLGQRKGGPHGSPLPSPLFPLPYSARTCGQNNPWRTAASPPPTPALPPSERGCSCSRTHFGVISGVPASTQEACWKKQECSNGSFPAQRVGNVPLVEAGRWQCSCPS